MFLRDLFIEVTDSFRIAVSVIRAHKMRSALTALGVIIGIIAVTLMGSAIGGIEIGFERSLAVDLAPGQVLTVSVNAGRLEIL